MKIHFLTTDLRGGGAQRVMLLLAKKFSESHEVTILCLNGGLEYDIPEQVKLIQLDYKKFPNKKIQGLLNLLRYYKRNEKPDVLIPFITHVNLIGILAARRFRIPIIASEHNSHVYRDTPVWLTKITWSLFYRFANYLTVLTEYDVEFYRKKGAKVVVMPNPCTFTPFKNFKKNRDKTILAIGDLNRYHSKGFDTLIDVVTSYSKKHPEWKVKIIGKGNKGLTHLRKLVEEEKLEGTIEFLGFKSNIAEYMQNAEIFALPSRKEGLPMVLLEAMSQGMTCIAFDCKTGPSDIIRDQFNGLLIEDQNKEAFIEGLNKLSSDAALRDELSKNGVQSLSKFSIDVINAKWEALFSEL